MAVPDVGRDIVFLDDLTHVGENFSCRGNGRPNPRFKAVPKGVQIAVRTNAWISVGFPSASETIHCLKNGECLVGTVVL